jgi:hypothetical protein
MNKSLVALAFVPLVTLLGSAPARADVPPPDTYSCMNLGVGAACDLQQTSPAHDGGGGPRGVCGTATCSRLDYAHWDQDASASPPSMQYECLKCLAPTDGGPADATALDGPPVADGAAGTGGTGGSSGTGGAAGAGGADGGSGTVGSKSDGSGCSLGGRQARALGPWALALVFGASVMFARRRRR